MAKQNRQSDPPWIATQVCGLARALDRAACISCVCFCIHIRFLQKHFLEPTMRCAIDSCGNRFAAARAGGSLGVVVVASNFFSETCDERALPLVGSRSESVWKGGSRGGVAAG